MLRFYYRLTDLSLSKFLRTFRNKLIAAHALGLKNYHRYLHAGSFTAEYRLDGNLAHIALEPAGKYYFEFECSAKPIQTLSSPDRYKPVKVGTYFYLEKGKITAKPAILGGKRLGFQGKSPIGEYQIQLANEPHITRADTVVSLLGKKKYPNYIIETFAPAVSYTGIYAQTPVLDMPFAPYASSYSMHFMRDFGVDYPFGYGLRKKPVRYGFMLDPDWQRASGVIRVKSERYGTRDFAVFVDTYQDFYCFPLEALTEDNETFNSGEDSIDPDLLKKSTPGYPAWMWRRTGTNFETQFAAAVDGDDIGEMFRDNPEYEWKFSHDGKKACAVVYAKDTTAIVYDTTFADYISTTYPTKAVLNTDFYYDTTILNAVGGQHDYLLAPASRTTDRFYWAPGLIEVKIKVEINGDKIDNFSFSTEVAEVFNPNTADYFTEAAGYYWYEDKLDEKIAKPGDLLVMQFIVYHNTNHSFHTRGHRIINVTQNKIVEYPFQGRILGVDFRSYSWVLQKYYETNEYKDGAYLTGVPQEEKDKYPPTMLLTTYNWAIGIYVFGKMREIAVPKTQYEFATNYLKNAFKPMVLEDETGALLPYTLSDASGWSNGIRGEVRDALAQATDLTNLTTEEKNLWFGGVYYPKMMYEEGSDATSIQRATPRGAATYGIRTYTTAYFNYMRLGWHIYAQQWIRGQMDWFPTDLIFYVHPSESWVFFTNRIAYDKNGTVGLAHSSWGYHYHFLNTYDYYDPALIEQTVIDIVHINFPTTDKPKTFRTSLRALYNEAILRGSGDKTLTEDFDKIEEADLQFEIQKTTGTSPVEWAHISPMKLRIRSRNTSNWYYKNVGECFKDDGTNWAHMVWASTQPQGNYMIDGTISPFDFFSYWTLESDPSITRDPLINEFPCRFATPRLYDR